MPSPHLQPFGNLASYRVYIRPQAYREYGHSTANIKHRDNVHELLRILFVNGNCTTWDMARIRVGKSRAERIRRQDKIYRRLLVGRTDRGKYSSGIINMGLVISEKTRPYYKHRLSLYGILYCIDALNPSKQEYDKMVLRYSYLLPRIFNDWKTTKSILGQDAYNLRVLAQGIYMNNINFARANNPLYELMMYLHTKYSKNFESISEHDLSEQISYWFYTFLLYSAPGKLTKVLSSDGSLHRWYIGFFREAKAYYTQRLRNIRDSGLL